MDTGHEDGRQQGKTGFFSFFLFSLVRRRGWKKNVLQINTGLLPSPVIFSYSSLRL